VENRLNARDRADVGVSKPRHGKQWIVIVETVMISRRREHEVLRIHRLIDNGFIPQGPAKVETALFNAIPPLDSLGFLSSWL
jgi:hypothetical protein